ncbi:MAG: sulfatase-like hydrolase/transferase [Planctomycetes bacterium]|nr:sulfatase-like hydrolase/transferase [Planctomycetota bacterium]
METSIVRALRGLLVAACAWLASSTASAQQLVGPVGAKRAVATPPEPLDVLVVVLDDVGVDQVGAYAASYPTTPQPCTPNLDDLAARGVRFTNGWVSPLCTPSRAMLLTGRPAQRVGTGTVTMIASTTQNGVPTNVPTLADLFQAQAPTVACTAALGKWHLADAGQLPNHPLDLGFAAWSGSFFNLNVKPSESPLCFDVSYCDWCKHSVDAQGSLAFPHHTNYATVDTTEDALTALTQFQGLSIPWLLYVSYNSTHLPFDCPQTCSHPCPTTTCGWCNSCPATGDDFGESRAMTEVLDAELGRLLAHVDFSRTAIIVLSDNGTQPSAVVPPFDPFHSKVTPYQGGINVPLVVWAPRCEAVGGRTCDELVSVTDVFATAADFAQLVLAPDPLRDSVSLAQYVDDRYDLSGGTPRTHVYSEMFDPNFVADAEGHAPPEYAARIHVRAVRNGRYKLIEKNRYLPTIGGTPNGTALELYELSHGVAPEDPAFGPDPFEQHDLLAGPGPLAPDAQAAFDELRAVLSDTYPALRCGLRATGSSAAVRDASGTSCSPGPLTVGFWTDGFGDTQVARSYLDFELSTLPVGARVLDAELVLHVDSSASSPSTAVASVPLAMPTPQYTCVPGHGLFEAGSVPAWSSVADWPPVGVAKRAPLGAAAGIEIASILCDAASAQRIPVFSVGLRFEFEAPPVSDFLVLAHPQGPRPPLLRAFYASSVPLSCP